MSVVNKQLWILAGGNGAGKSTFYRTQLESKGVEFVNADLIEKQIDPLPAERSSYEAASIARWKFRELIAQGRSFCFETVFSHESKLEMLEFAKSRDYETTLVYIHLRHSDLNVLRVGQRISEGGHWVPEEKIVARVARTHRLMCKAVKRADRSYHLDNSSRKNPFQQVAVKKEEEIHAFVDPLPKWAASILFG